MPSLTRREFLRALVPRWLTRRVISISLGTAVALFLGAELIDTVRTNGLGGTARFVGILAGAGVVVYLLARLAMALGQAVGRRSEDFRLFVSNLMRLLGCVIAMLVGASLNARWNAGEDIAPTLVALAVVLILVIFRDGLKRQ